MAEKFSVFFVKNKDKNVDNKIKMRNQKINKTQFPQIPTSFYFLQNGLDF